MAYKRSVSKKTFYNKPLEPGPLTWTMITIPALLSASFAASWCYQEAKDWPSLFPLVRITSEPKTSFAMIAFFVVAVVGLLIGRAIWWAIIVAVKRIRS